MIQQEFAAKAKTILEPDDNVIVLAVAGSWLTNELDEFSDLDLILVTNQKVSGDKSLMLDYAKRLGYRKGQSAYAVVINFSGKAFGYDNRDDKVQSFCIFALECLLCCCGNNPTRYRQCNTTSPIINKGKK